MTASYSSGPTTRLARFAHELQLRDVPGEVIEKVKVHILDQLGNQLVGACLPWNRGIRNYSVRYARAGSSTIVGSGEMLDAEFAALTNGTAGHGSQNDDYHAGLGHHGCVAVPSTFAVAEEQGASGADFLLAATIAFEIGSRVGLGVFPSMLTRGFQSCAPAIYGAGAAAARLMNLSPTQLRDAMSVAGNHASGVLEHAITGGEVKRMQAGMTAAAAVRSARVAGFGMTGPPAILEGKKGYLQAFSDDPHPERLTAGLGDTWALLDLRIKPYACNGLIIQQIDALKRVLTAHRIDGGRIEEIVVGVDRTAYQMAGNFGPQPTDMMSAQFSTHFSLALTATKGRNDFGAYLDEAVGGFGDADVLRIARRVKIVIDPECEAQFPARWVAKVTVRTTDGNSYSAEADGKPDIARSQVESKFEQLAGRVLPSSRVAQIVETVMNVEAMPTTAPLSELVRAAGLPSLLPEAV